MDGLHFFDPGQEFTITWKRLPHWAQAGTVCFVTWRTADSLPKEVIERILKEREDLLRRFGFDPRGEWKRQLAKLPAQRRGRVQWSLFCAWDRELDQAAGECVLARPEFSQLVADSLMHFDGDRYVLTDYVVMPNHVHLLAAFREEKALETQCTSWKRFTAIGIHGMLGRCGPFWQVDQFDHLVRSAEQFEHYRRYIAENPMKANLKPGMYRHYSKQLT